MDRVDRLRAGPSTGEEGGPPHRRGVEGYRAGGVQAPELGAVDWPEEEVNVSKVGIGVGFIKLLGK